MLPIFRLIPVGGVFLAIAILLLALNPPRATSPSARVELLPARGPLLDRAEHPEWRQFLILAALRRAGEVERLRDLHDTIVRTTAPPSVPETARPAPVAAKPEIGGPIALKQEASTPAVGERGPAVAAPKVAEATPVDAELNGDLPTPIDAKPDALASKVAKAATVTAEPAAAERPLAEAEHETIEPAAAKPEAATAASVAADSNVAETEPKVAEAAPVEPKLGTTETTASAMEPKVSEPTPPIAAEPKIAEAAPVETKPQVPEAKPIAVIPKVPEATPIAAEPKVAENAPLLAKPDVSELVPPAAEPATAATPVEQKVAAPVFRLETNGSRVAADTVPPETSPDKIKVAILSAQPAQSDDNDITGSVEPAHKSVTIPVGIGEASSTELEVTLPRERPPVLQRLDRRRVRESKIERRRHRGHYASRARTRKSHPASLPPEFDIFALLFQAFALDAKTEPFKPVIPYEPGKGSIPQ